MRLGIIGAVMAGVLAAGGAAAETAAKENIVLVIHGGAGTIRKAAMTPEREREYREKLAEALRAGWAVLDKGGASLDAVETTIRVMEDSPLFNSGKGAVFTHDGHNELDASIMDGATRRAGAVAGVRIIRNPISAARAVMEKSEHVLLTGRGAELFATRQGLEIVDPSYFWTERRWKQLQDALRAEEDPAAAAKLDPEMEPVIHKFGTVGAVALDKAGNLAAGTSTGGMTNKRWARVGDSPIIGAGTWADNDTCAISSTGHGEFFIRWAAAHEVAALMRYGGRTVAEAAREVIHGQLAPVGADGGMIALDAEGNFAMPFNTEGMYRGWIRADGVPHVALYEEE